jgi:hypothetical protein
MGSQYVLIRARVSKDALANVHVSGINSKTPRFWLESASADCAAMKVDDAMISLDSQEIDIEKTPLPVDALVMPAYGTVSTTRANDGSWLIGEFHAIKLWLNFDKSFIASNCPCAATLVPIASQAETATTRWIFMRVRVELPLMIKNLSNDSAGHVELCIPMLVLSPDAKAEGEPAASENHKQKKAKAKAGKPQAEITSDEIPPELVSHSGNPHFMQRVTLCRRKYAVR